MMRQMPLYCPPTSGADEGGSQEAWAWPVDVLDLDTLFVLHMVVHVHVEDG